MTILHLYNKAIANVNKYLKVTKEKPTVYITTPTFIQSNNTYPTNYKPPL